MDENRKNNNVQAADADKASSSVSPRTKKLLSKKSRSYIRIGKIRIKPRFVVIVVLTCVLLGLLLSLFINRPEYYSLASSSITLVQTADALIVKDEQAHIVDAGSRVLFQVPEGAVLNEGDTEMIYESVDFNLDWYSQYAIACRNTVTYIKSVLTNEVVLAAVDVLEEQIELVEDKIVFAIASGNPADTQANLDELSLLIDTRISDLRQAIGYAPELDGYLLKEQQIKERMDAALVTNICDFSGVICYNTDGWGNVVTYADIEYLTGDIFTTITEDSSALYSEQRAKNAYYVVNPSRFYLAFHGGDMMGYLKEGDEILIRLSADGEEYTAEVVKVEAYGLETFVVVRLSAYLPQIVRERSVTVYIKKTWNGVVIPQNYTVTKKGQQGVYLLVDKKRVFTPVYVLTQDENIILPDTEMLGSYVFKAGDKILKKGK